MDEVQQVFAYEQYLDQRKANYGLVCDDLPYSANLDLIVAQVNLQFGTRFSHGEVYQAICHIRRRSDLRERGLRRESDVPLHGRK
jgi:hypothetical protein